MSMSENWVLKNFPSPFARLGTGAAINALAELIILIFNFNFFYLSHTTNGIETVYIQR